MTPGGAQPCPHLEFRLPASRLGREGISVALSPQVVVLGYGSPRKSRVKLADIITTCTPRWLPPGAWPLLGAPGFPNHSQKGCPGSRTWLHWAGEAGPQLATLPSSGDGPSSWKVVAGLQLVIISGTQQSLPAPHNAGPSLRSLFSSI